jgi:hypothetical protein
MGLRPLFIAVLLAAAAWSAEAQPAFDEAHDHYVDELDRQCPDKQLQMLGARDLRDGLDSYLSGLDPDVRDQLQKSEVDHCSSSDAGAACVNLADIAAADQIGHLPDLVASICASFLRCKGDGDCIYAR